MKPTLALKIAAAVMLLHAIGHTIGIYTWKNPAGPVPQEVVKMMSDVNFPFQGAEGNMAKFYEGMGYASTFSLLLTVAILWMIAGFPAENSKLSVKVLIPVAWFLFLLGIDELIWFFPMAAAFSFVAMLLTGFAIFNLRNSHTH